ncbi:E3 ubiquitin-protein ligase rififylin isoform X1 [Acipenser ruthenus]|uniref:E3 ubiquitin-protein ligase rififylin isoform X1 n=1 Tax=Acipenser ruthenus TaxID=7906 RepID=UPI00145A8B4E|nr:E3 ubiquitin-protein ligase rififylin isoform X1 [Acipenser ruthenus]XP_058857523.1 E3 ubiquitin-protein ligase rififylin isoform X1 [Acipenser ruthenus]XP_058857524.1 E3 ubiquitin-protein ligase rififylin isoform X1 [Acipenser ruthenus]XP_058857525.1 E3 ubiquitin-protein ligase rififylin isoform X1 [Acipenser ruthenus]
MWASCCNWLCLDTQPVEEERGRSQRQAYTNSGFRPSPPRPAPEHTCKACGSHFSTSSRKHVCMDCKKSFCASCSVQPALSPRMCLSCQRCCGTAFLRTELMKLKVKELRDYLHLHEVSTELCREKEDLVELVLGQHTPPASQGPNPPATGATQATSQGGPSPHTEPAAEPLAEEGQQNLAAAIPPSQEGETPASGSGAEAQEQEEGETQSSDTEEPLPPGRRASLSDLKELEDIDALTVRQLKEILARNFVNYKGCCEKWELMERVTRLYNEQKELQDLVASNGANRDTAAPPGSEENLCKICMDSPIDCVLLECGHMVTCTKCGKRMSECPICRQYVVRAVHVFKS